MWYEQLQEGTLSNPYKFAVVLERANYVDLNSFAEIFKNRRSITCWYWVSGEKITTSLKPLIASGWLRFLTFKNGKWKKIVKDRSIIARNIGSPLMPAHVFFKTEAEFKAWIGSKYSVNLFSELL